MKTLFELEDIKCGLQVKDSQGTVYIIASALFNTSVGDVYSVVQLKYPFIPLDENFWDTTDELVELLNANNYQLA